MFQHQNQVATEFILRLVQQLQIFWEHFKLLPPSVHNFFAAVVGLVGVTLGLLFNAQRERSNGNNIRQRERDQSDSDLRKQCFFEAADANCIALDFLICADSTSKREEEFRELLSEYNHKSAKLLLIAGSAALVPYTQFQKVFLSVVKEIDPLRRNMTALKEESDLLQSHLNGTTLFARTPNEFNVNKQQQSALEAVNLEYVERLSRNRLKISELSCQIRTLATKRTEDLNGYNHIFLIGAKAELGFASYSQGAFVFGLVGHRWAMKTFPEYKKWAEENLTDLEERLKNEMKNDGFIKSK